MDCKYLKECGSCTLFTPYSEQISFKTDLIKQNFSHFYEGKFDVFSSSPKHYRTRAEFGIWHEGSKLSYTMHAKEKGKKVFIDECPKVCEQISHLMPRLLESLQDDEILRTKLFGVEFIACKSGTLVTLLYHKKLGSEFEAAMKILASKLDVMILARSRGQKLLSGELNLVDELNIDGEIYKFSLSENAFIQPNKAVNEKMIAWAKECVQGGADLLELYCGHGNFTIPLSFKFKNVLATEISKSSIANALKNCELNGAENIKFLRMDADELMSAFAGVREFNRLKDISLNDFNFSHVLVDPPRAGLSESVINFIRNFKNIIYISCNPETLKENLNELTKSHKVIKFALFDQFANTHHIECGVLLEAKDKF